MWQRLKQIINLVKRELDEPLNWLLFLIFINAMQTTVIIILSMVLKAHNIHLTIG